MLRPHGVDITRLGDGYALTGSVLVDSGEFDGLVSTGRSALRAGDPHRSAEALTAALRLWRGRPFDGVDAAAFTDAARPPLEATRAAAMADLAEANLRRGEPTAALHTAQAMVTDHPLDERGWIALASAYYFSGQQDQALDTCRKARDLLVEELGVDPTPALAELEAQVLDHTVPQRTTPPSAGPQPAPGAAATPPPLPPIPTPFVGREALVDDVLARLADGARLVTLAGIGGIGKTSAALAVAHRLASDQPVWFCPVETDTDPADVWTRLSRLIGTDSTGEPDGPAEAVAAGRPVGVLLLDNVEQVVGMGTLLDRLLAVAPDLTILVTSRRPTGVRAEHLVSVPVLTQDHAEQLFRVRADQIRQGSGDVRSEEIRALCARLDGIPLAVELAAARTRSLSPRQLLARIESRHLSVLDGATGVVVPGRQASLRSVLHDAYETLPDEAQRLVQLMGSFDGWVSIELLERAGEGWILDIVDAVDTVVVAGLVTTDADGRVRMLGPVREFAAAIGPRSDLDTRLTIAVTELAADAAPRLFGDKAGAAVEDLHRDDDALTAALGMLLAAGSGNTAGELVLHLNRYWLLSGRLAEARRWIERAGTAPGLTPQTAARVALLAGTYASYVNDPRTADLLRPSLATADELGLPIDRLRVNGWCCLAAFAAMHDDPALAAESANRAQQLAAAGADDSLVSLARDVEGFVASQTGDHQGSLAVALRGLVDARRAGNGYDVVQLLITAAVDLLYLDRLDEALAYADEAFQLAGTIDVGPLAAYVLIIQGSALVAAGRSSAGRGCLVEALRLFRERTPDPLATADILFTLGASEAHELNGDQACRYFGAAEALYQGQGVAAAERLAAPIFGAKARIIELVGATRFDVMAALGATDPDHTIELVLAHRGRSPQPAST